VTRISTILLGVVGAVTALALASQRADAYPQYQLSRDQTCTN
jgi:hypothetical protein